MGTLTKQPLKPVVRITKNDGTYYNFNPFTSTFDFRLTGDFVVDGAFDNTGGNFDITIIAPENPPSNSTANTILSNIREGNEILFQFGKSDAGKEGYLLGVIEDIQVTEPNKNLMEIHLTGWDWGTNLFTGVLVDFDIEQDRQADGKTPDTADKRTKFYNITKQLLGIGVNKDGTEAGDSDVAYPGSQPTQKITAKDRGLVVSSANIVDRNTSVPNFSAKWITLQDALNAVDSMDNTIHYADTSKNFIRRQPYDSSITTPVALITDDPSDARIADYTYYGLIAPPCDFISTTQSRRQRIFALGNGAGQADTTASKETQTGDVNVDNQFVAIQFQPNYRNCSAIAVYLKKTGSPPDNLYVELWEDVNNAPGSFVAGGQRTSDRISTSYGWHYFPVNKTLNVSKKYWIVIVPPNQTSDTANCYVWGKDSTVNATNATSSNGTTWTVNSANSYNLNFRIDFTDKIALEWPANGADATAKHFTEEVIQNPAMPGDTSVETTMIQYVSTQYSTLQKRKQIFRCLVYSPDILLLPGYTVRIRKQLTGKTFDNQDWVVTSAKYRFSSADAESTGSFYVDCTFSRYADYP